jgi:release factor glutamine methyltransferase
MNTQLVDEALVPFGPVMAARASWLRTEGLMDPDSATERLVVIAAQRRTC